MPRTISLLMAERAQGSDRFLQNFDLELLGVFCLFTSLIASSLQCLKVVFHARSYFAPFVFFFFNGFNLPIPTSMDTLEKQLNLVRNTSAHIVVRAHNFVTDELYFFV